ncbi:uncharacterized protein LOC133831994 [Humulus lupulus]|uniref:uncharacterized protein LOC133831994 n=1 Tax=Humulus lupulus TaxID=3486 RepID=UPI002B409DA4|nr:uncharacterized protein LOC133831994 [Humulus lupulus]
MAKDRLSKEYEDGVESFIEIALKNTVDPKRVHCPCQKCSNLKKLDIKEIKNHLYFNGIDKTYVKWIWHGEQVESTPKVHNENKEFTQVFDDPIEMVRDAVDRFVDRLEEFVKFLGDAEKPIFPGSPLSKLVVLVKLYNLKAGSGWSDISFTKLLDLMKEILPKDNEMPSSLYEAKKTLCTLGMDYKKIHACPNDCVLYRNNLENATECPTCKTSRWKRGKEGKEGKKGIPAKVLWYFPPIPRFIRLFRNPEHAKSLRWHEHGRIKDDLYRNNLENATECPTYKTSRWKREHAKSLRWHEDGRIKDDKLRHPADSLAWKTIDEKWPVIKKDPRNLRLGLSADGINPFSNMSSSYRSKQPGNDIDVYLAPLIDDLKLLWDGVDCYDSFSKESFILRGLLLWTINDFPAYGNLSGCYVKGYKGCTICGEKTSATRLKFCKKTCYMGHRRFLPTEHYLRNQMKAFNDKQELQGPPPIMTGEEIYEEIRLINNRFRKPVTNTEECEDIESRVKSKGKSKMSKKRKRSKKHQVSNDDSLNTTCWKKKSIFF